MTGNDCAFVLHSRPYRETSQLLSLFTWQHGRFNVIARGRTKENGCRQPFVELQVGWSGRSDLKTLTGSESVKHHVLSGDSLLIGMYLNELLMRLLHDHDPHPEIFDHYRLLVSILSTGVSIEPQLRRFELHLLQELGYGFSFDCDAASGKEIQAEKSYRFIPDEGFVESTGADQRTFSGRTILLFATNQLEDDTARLEAKRLMRLALAPHLGNRPLASRELFAARRGVAGDMRAL